MQIQYVGLWPCALQVDVSNPVRSRTGDFFFVCRFFFTCVVWDRVCFSQLKVTFGNSC